MSKNIKIEESWIRRVRVAVTRDFKGEWNQKKFWLRHGPDLPPKMADGDFEHIFFWVDGEDLFNDNERIDIEKNLLEAFDEWLPDINIKIEGEYDSELDVWEVEVN